MQPLERKIKKPVDIPIKTGIVEPMNNTNRQLARGVLDSMDKVTPGGASQRFYYARRNRHLGLWTGALLTVALALTILAAVIGANP